MLCIEAAYRSRLQSLREQGLHAASPAVYEETQPFRASEVALTRAPSFLGKSSSPPMRPWLALNLFRGSPIIFNGFEAYPQRTGVDRFAFLLHIDDKAPRRCLMVDAVAFPKSTTADAFLSCSDPDVPSPGVGMRLSGQQGLVAYWFVDAPSKKFQRQPLVVLSAATSTRCREPESGE